ncbi:hypothetical protein LB519_14675 [Mesorhizobium sp. AD1-1]|uniref:hypothetical protein n=1 Tax=Mesorhizobium sp. AD1-1 TaxID=2876621 RepID=UPI001CCCCEA7|nr:hypothetical protein [Mesorhizobium sp. AD1-1]MBZ9719090.1 hypothetical protein [Mesorhizobium sp. AD1-1]
MVFTVETMRDGKALKRAEVQAETFDEAAATVGPFTAGSGREPASGEWIRVTQFVSGRTNWFRVEQS